MALAARKSRIQASLCDPAQPKRQRSDSRMKDDFTGCLTEPLHQRLRTGDAGKIQLSASRRMNRYIVEHRAMSARRKEKLIAGRCKHRRQQWRTTLDQRCAHAPVFAAGEIAAGAVDRIDDPDQRFAETRLVIGAFFRQPAVIRRGRSQPALEQVVNADIGFGHR